MKSFTHALLQDHFIFLLLSAWDTTYLPLSQDETYSIQNQESLFSELSLHIVKPGAGGVCHWHTGLQATIEEKHMFSNWHSITMLSSCKDLLLLSFHAEQFITSTLFETAHKLEINLYVWLGIAPNYNINYWCWMISMKLFLQLWVFKIPS